MSNVNRRVLPGFSLTLGYSIFYLSVLVLIPIAACVIRGASIGRDEFIRTVWSERARSAYAVTFGTSFVAALINVVLGLLIAWVLVRYKFPAKRIFDSLVDVPLALPTSVAGLVYSTLYVETGWFGRFLVPAGIQAVYTRLGIVLVLTFIGLPFIVRTVQPVLEAMQPDPEEAAGCLGATRWQTFRHITLPTLYPSLLTGFALGFARCLGEYGSVVFVSGNLPHQTEIAAVLIVARLEEFAYGEATAIALVLLVFSFLLLIATNMLERWTRRYHGG